MKSNDLSEGEELSREACFNHLYVTFTPSLTENEERIESFKTKIFQLINTGVIYGLRLDSYKIILMFNQNKITKIESYDLLCEVYILYFSESISLFTFLKTIYSLFYHYHKSLTSLYDSIRKHKSKKVVHSI